MKKLLLSCIVGVAVLATSAVANPYAKYKGTTLVISWPSLGGFKAAEPILKQFTKETGIKVEVDALPYLKLRDRQLVEMSKSRGEYDIVSWVVMWKGEYVNKGLLTPLSQMYTNASLIDPDYDFDDLPKKLVENGSIVGGEKGYLPGITGGLYGIPFEAETSILAYRKDIFEKYGIAVPKTYDDMRAVMNKLYSLGIPALTSRGKTGHQVTAAYLLHLAPMGGRIFDDNWNPIVNSKESVAAAEFMRLVAKTGPRGIATFGFGEATAAFLQGDAAMYLDSFKVGPRIRDPKISKVIGKVGYALHPTDVRCGSETGGFALGIPANSQNKEAAFLLIQYLSNKENDLKRVEYGGMPTRLSTFKALSYKYADYPVIMRQMPCADPDWRPLIPEWNEINIDALGQALTKVITTDDPIQPIMDEANEKIRRIMEREGYYVWRK